MRKLGLRKTYSWLFSSSLLVTWGALVLGRLLVEAILLRGSEDSSFVFFFHVFMGKEALA